MILWAIPGSLVTWIQLTLEEALFSVTRLLSPSVTRQSGAWRSGKATWSAVEDSKLVHIWKKKKKKSPWNFLSLPLRPGKTRAYHEIVVLGLPRERNAPCAKSIRCWLIPQEDLPFLVSLELSGCCSEAEPAPRFTLPLYQAVEKTDNIQRWSRMARVVALWLVQGTVYMVL